MHALLQNNAALACEADPSRPKTPTAQTAPNRPPNPDRHRPLGHRPSLGGARRAAEWGEMPQMEPSKGQGRAVTLASPCRRQGAQVAGGACWVTIRHGPCGPVVHCRIPEHLLLA